VSISSPLLVNSSIVISLQPSPHGYQLGVVLVEKQATEFPSAVNPPLVH